MNLMQLRDVVEIHYGEGLKSDLRDENCPYPVYGANGIVGRYKDYIVDHQSIVIGRKGSCGEINLAPAKFWPIDTTFYTKIKDESRLDNLYLYYALKAIDLKHLIITTSIPGINRDSIYKIKIPLPPKTVQQKIISLLQKTESTLEKRRQTLRLADDFLKSAFWEMFGDPLSNNKKWSVEKLGDVLDIRDGTHDSPQYINEGIPLVTSKNLKDGEVDFSNINYISVKDQKKIDKRSFVDDGDILYGMIGTIGSPVIAKKNREFCIKNVALFKFEDSKMDRYFVRMLMSDDFMTKKLLGTKRGGTQKFVSLSMLRSFGIPVPPLPLQQKFADLVQKVEKLKEKQKQSESQLQNLFNALMQGAFRDELI